jgi:hypothetical protein
MAIDTTKKRASISGIVWADGALDQADMQTISMVYGGNLFGAPIELGDRIVSIIKADIVETEDIPASAAIQPAMLVGIREVASPTAKRAWDGS